MPYTLVDENLRGVYPDMGYPMTAVVNKEVGLGIQHSLEWRITVSIAEYVRL